MASAEERHLGTHEWQLLLPVAAWQQWALKVAVALTLALLLGVAVPALLSLLLRASDFRMFFSRGATVIVVGLFAVGSLYLSTVSSTGLWALLASLPSAIALVLFCSWSPSRSRIDPSGSCMTGVTRRPRSRAPRRGSGAASCPACC